MKKIIVVLSALTSVFSAVVVILYRIFLRTDIEKFPGRIEPEDEKWLRRSNKKDIYLTSRDGLFLHGILLENSGINIYMRKKVRIYNFFIIMQSGSWVH